jgi:CRP-like cAMP-binding protein
MKQPEKTSDDAALMEVSLRLTQGFAAWPPAAMAQLLSSSELGRHARGDLVASEAGATETFAIVTGHVLGGLPRGGTRTVVFFGPGMVVGLARVFDAEFPVELYHYHAHDDVVAVHMPTLLVLEILDREPRLWKDIAHMTLKQHGLVRDAFLSHAIGVFRRRLAATIDRLAALYGTDAQGTLRLRVRQEDLAAMLQVSRQSVNKEIGTMADAGVIRSEYNTLTILDHEALRELASAR